MKTTSTRTIQRNYDEQPFYAEELPKCSTCEKDMDDSEHNYGTEESLCCLRCYQDAQDDQMKDDDWKNFNNSQFKTK